MQLSRAEFTNKLYTPAVATTTASSAPSPAAPAPQPPRPKKVNDFVDHRCPTVSEQRGASATTLPRAQKNAATSSDQLSLRCEVTKTAAPNAAGQMPRHPLRQTDVTQHASRALAVGHGNIFGKGASVTTKGWTQGKFV